MTPGSRKDRADRARLAAALNAAAHDFAPWMRDGGIIHVTNKAMRGVPDGSPAWYDPRQGDVYVHHERLFPGVPVAELEAALRAALRESKRLMARHRVSSLFEGIVHSTFADDVLMGLTLMGVVQHEAAHSQWSHWMSALSSRAEVKRMKITSAEATVMILMEELRIEARALVHDRVTSKGEITRRLRETEEPSVTFGAAPLRACFGWLLKNGVSAAHDSDDVEGADRGSVAAAWTLSYGRCITGVAVEDDVEEMDALARTVLGDEKVDQLVGVLNQAIDVAPGPLEESYAADEARAKAVASVLVAARTWIEIVGLEPPPSSESVVVVTPPMAGDGEGGSGRGSGDSDDDSDDDSAGSGGSDDGDDDSDGNGDGDADGGGAGYGEGLEAMAGSLTAGPDQMGEDDGDPEIVDSGDISHMDVSHGFSNTRASGDEELLAKELSDVIENTLHRVADSVTTPVPEVPAQLSDAAEHYAEAIGNKGRGRATSLFKEEDPSPELMRLTQETARRLEQIQTPAIVRSTSSSLLPPGRLRSRDALVAQADRKQGRATTALPWKTTRRRHELVRPTNIGIMTDVSGSMSWAERVVAEYAFVYGKGGARINARCMSVTFGSTVEVALSPGDIPSKLRIRPARDGHESFDEAAATLEGGLRMLTNINDVRIVLIVSDGHLVETGQPERAREWVRRWTDAGVYVAWIGHDTNDRYGGCLSTMDIKRNKRLSVTDGRGKTEDLVRSTNDMIRDLVHADAI